MSKPAQDQHSPPLQQFLNTIPSPLTTVLVGLGPYISTIRHVFQVVSWKSSWEESWLAIALWWAACLLGDVALRYILPLATLSVILLTRWTAHPQTQAPLITEDTLHQTVSDLLTIHALIPRLPTPPTTLLPVLLRISAITYIPYLFLTHLIRLRVIIALTGTVLLTWRARWASLIRKGLWRSAYIRWATYRTWAFISGQPLPPPTLSPQSQSLHLLPTTPSSASSLSTLSPTTPTPTTSPASSSVISSSIGRVIPLNDPPTVNSFRFLFTVYENQRWWMGLDFTAALLPGERPSWCSASHQPVAPPSMFSLPSPTTVFMRQTLPSPQSNSSSLITGKGKSKAKAKIVETRVKRVARWTWEEPEWKVIIHKEGHPLSRVERQLPSAEAENSGSTGSASRLLKAAGKMRQASLSASGSASLREGSPERHRDEAGHSMEGSINGASGGADKSDEVFTDLDGWVYGDNKWEGGSSKGGMGKYTRYRRWTRIAILSETVYPAEEDPTIPSLSLGIRKDCEEPPNPDTHLSIPLPIPPMSASSTSTATSPNSARSRESSEADAGFFELSPIDDDGKARLRQRLQAAVKSGAHS